MHNNDNHNSSMMWMMVLCCALPIVFLALFSSKPIGTSAWIILGAMAAFLIIHFWLMKKSHDNPVKLKNNKSGTKSNSRHNCCH